MNAGPTTGREEANRRGEGKREREGEKVKGKEKDDVTKKERGKETNGALDECNKILHPQLHTSLPTEMQDNTAALGVINHIRRNLISLSNSIISLKVCVLSSCAERERERQ